MKLNLDAKTQGQERVLEYMQCNVSNKNAGQFFTPYHISKLSAKMILDSDKLNKKIAADEVITLG